MIFLAGKYVNLPAPSHFLGKELFGCFPGKSVHNLFDLDGLIFLLRN